MLFGMKKNGNGAGTEPGGQGPAGQDDATDPMGLALEQVEQAKVLVEGGNGVLLENVILQLPKGQSDSFLRLSIAEASPVADAIRQTLLDAPEETTGFKDLLVHGEYALCAKLHGMELASDVLERTKAGGYYLRPIDVVKGLGGLAALLAIVEQRFGLRWESPSLSQLGVLGCPGTAGGAARAGLAFLGWGNLGEGAGTGTPGLLVSLFAQLLSGLEAAARQNSLEFSSSMLQPLIAALNGMAASGSLTFEVISEWVENFGPAHAGFGVTDEGRKREHNEDAYLLLDLDQQSSSGAHLFLAAVADGMGGHASGEIASSLALSLLRQRLLQDIFPPSTKPANTGMLAPALQGAIPWLDDVITERANMEPSLQGMGTTLVGYACFAGASTIGSAAGPSAAVVHVGDSRAYVVGPSGIRPVTKDHSFVQDLIDSGNITAEEARSHQMKNVITRSIGGGSAKAEPDITEFELGPGEYLLLCTDGLSDVLDDQAILSAFTGSGATSEVIASRLVGMANDGGGPDNITAILVSREMG